MTDIVSATDLSRRYGEGEAAVDALDGVTVGFPRGAFTAIMGASGSGKSTLMHCLAGPRHADGRHASSSTASSSARSATRSSPSCGATRSASSSRRSTSCRSSPRRRTSSCRSRSPARRPTTGGSSSSSRPSAWATAARTAPRELSGGQQQRVAVARALVHKPAVVFADEPTGNLDSKASAEVLDLLRQAVDEFGQTVVMVTHDPDAAAIADRLIELADGRIVRDEAVVAAAR